MIGEEESAPNFELPGTEGDEIDTYRMSNYTTDGAVVLTFYPFDFSPVCTEIFCKFRDHESLILTEDVDVFGVSRDSCYAHKKFIQEYELPFPLLSDYEGRVAETYGFLHGELEHHERVPKRALVTIDDSHTVHYTWHTNDPYKHPSLDELHQTVRALSGRGS